jgi:hypothetical protein
MTSTRTGAIALCLLAAAACRSGDTGSRAPRPLVVATFSGTVDAATGAVTIRADRPEGPAPGDPLASVVEIPVEQDGVPGSGTADTTELVTERAATVAGACGAVDGFEGDIRIRSFYAGAVLTNVHVELTSLTPTGREACNSAARYEQLSDAFGLWDHGTLGRAGGGFDTSLRTWRFRLPDQTRFVFRGRVMADLVTSDPNPPTTVAVAGAGGETSVELRCTDAETGCAVTHYTTDGTEPTTASPVYAGPIPVTAGTTLRWFSIDYWGNVENVTDRWWVSGPGSATLEPGGIAFDGNGDGLAVWRTRGQKVVYSCFTAASGNWTTSAVLDSSAGAGYQGPRVAASASGFAVAWFGPRVKAAVFSGCTPGTVQTLATGFYGYNLAVSSNGTSFLVAWAGTQSGSWASEYGGASWSAPSFFTSATFPDSIAVAGEGQGYRAVYIRSGTVYSVRRVGGAWSSPSSLGPGRAVAVASAGEATCITWFDSSLLAVNARLEVGGTGTTVPVIMSGFLPTASVGAAVNGGRCQVVAAAEAGAYGALYDGASWAPPASLGLGAAASVVGVAPRGAQDFAAVALVAGNVWVNRTAAGAWGTARLAEGSSEPARLPLIAAGSPSVAQVLFAQADANADQVWSVRYDGTSVNAPGLVSIPVNEGNSSGVQMAAAANGDALAIWTQEHRARSNVFWASRRAGLWGTPQLLAADASAAAVASNGTDFMIAYRAGLSASRTLVARRFSGGAFGAPTTISSGYDGSQSEKLASDGEGYAISYVVYASFSQGNQPLARIFDGTSWGAVKWLAAAGSKSADVSIAGRTGEYLLAWINETSTTVSAMSWRATRSGVTWSWEPASRTIASGVGWSAVVLAAGPGGFAAVYPASGGVGAAIMTGGTWSTLTPLRADGADTFAVASNGTGYMAATSRASSGGVETQVHAWDGVWRSGRPVGYIGGFRLAAASNGSGYGLLADGRTTSELMFISVPEPIAGPIGTPIRLDTATPTTTPAPPIVSASGGFLAAWTQQDPADAGTARIFAVGGL